MKKYAIALALAAGCTHKENSMPKDEILVEIVSITPADPVEGDGVEVSYRLTNGSKDVIVVGPGRSEYGSLETREGAVDHHHMSQEATPAVFHGKDNILLPGESSTMSFQLEATRPEVRASAAVARYPEASFAVYVVYLREGMPGHMTTYEKMTAAAFAGLRSREKERIGGCIIFPEGGARSEASASTKIALKPRAFPLAEAKKKFGGEVEEVHWSKTLDAWALSGGGRAGIVKTSGVSELPRGSVTLIVDLDAGAKSFEFRLSKPEATALSKNFKTHEGDGMYTRGTFITVPAEKLLDALETARKEGLSIRKVFYFFKSYYFEL